MVHASTALEAAQGAILGLACGDAAGGVLEFSGSVSAEEAAWALTMPGGGNIPWPNAEESSQAEQGKLHQFSYTSVLCTAGCWRLGRGQFTDDTELALSLANGLLLHGGTSQTFPTDQVAQQYIK